MALPASGPISLAAIQAEFQRGGVNPISLSEYYRGGSYVLGTDTGVAGIAASGAINMNSFHGAGRNGYYATAGNASGSCSSLWPTTGCTATTNAVTVSVFGGSGNYSYSWAFVSGTSFTITSPSSATTTFSRNAAGSDGDGTPGYSSYSGIARCTIHDNVTSLNTTVDITVTTYHSWFN